MSDEEDRDRKDYDVGYRKPPVGRRFQKGQSGNPKGRPRGDQNFKTLIGLELAEMENITDRGVPTRLSWRRLMARQFVRKAGAGSVRHAEVVLANDPLSAQVVEEVAGALSRPADELTKENLVRRLRAALRPDDGIEETEMPTQGPDRRDGDS